MKTYFAYVYQFDKNMWVTFMCFRSLIVTITFIYLCRALSHHCSLTFVGVLIAGYETHQFSLCVLHEICQSLYLYVALYSVVALMLVSSTSAPLFARGSTQLSRKLWSVVTTDCLWIN